MSSAVKTRIYVSQLERLLQKLSILSNLKIDSSLSNIQHERNLFRILREHSFDEYVILKAQGVITQDFGRTGRQFILPLYHCYVTPVE